MAMNHDDDPDFQDDFRMAPEPRQEVLYPRAKDFWSRVEAHYQSRNGRVGKFKHKDLGAPGKPGIVDPPTWTRIRRGQSPVPETKLDEFRKLFAESFDEEEFRQAYTETCVVDLEHWRPDVGTFEWPPFCDRRGRSGFLVHATQRLFRLAGKVGKQEPIFSPKPFAQLLSGDLSLALAETIGRTRKATIFHSPCLMGVNLVGRFDSPAFPRAAALLLNGEGDDGPIPIVTVAGEVGDEYIRSLPHAVSRRIVREILPGHEQDLAAALNERLAQGAFYCADELTCLLKACELKDQCGVLFPLGTAQVARSSTYSRLPIYKVGLFTVPEYQQRIISFLQKALRVYLENELEETAQQYAVLYQELAETARGAIQCMAKSAQNYLEELHKNCGDDFYPGVKVDEVLADRWARRCLRLYPHQAALDLNLPWQPILARAREIVPPVPNQTRTPGERRVAATYRELPPVISPEPGLDFTLFEAVLGPLRPHLELSKATRYERKLAQSHLGGDSPSTVAVGFFAIPPRLFDWRFFRFPVELKFAGVVLGEPSPDQMERCRALLDILDSGRPIDVQGLTTPILMLDHGAVHNLLRDHRIHFDSFRLVDDSGGDRGMAFRTAAEDLPTAIVVADELTCLAVAGAVKGDRPIRLVNHRLQQPPSAAPGGSGPYFSVAVRSSAPEWVRFFEQAVPLSLETYRESIARSHAALYHTLYRWVQDSSCKLPGLEDTAHEVVAAWCRRVLMLDRPGELAPEWDPILSRARQLVDDAS